MSQLSGNSANAELAAKERVNAVRNLSPLSHPVPQFTTIRAGRWTAGEVFNYPSVHLSRHLVNGLVGNIGQSNPPRLPLMTGCWGIVYSDERVYLGKGVCVVRNLTRFD